MTEAPLDLAIIGAPKAGTTSLYTWLAAHPGVLGSSAKETLYFIDRDHELFFWEGSETSWPTFNEQGWEGFEQFFPEPRNGRLRLEATPANLFFTLPRQLFAALDPQPLLIITLRDPAEQIRSAFYFSQNNGAAGNFIDPGLDFANYVDALLSGDLDLQKEVIPNDQLRRYFTDKILAFNRYVEWLDLWAEKFPPERILILRFADLTASPRTALGAICQRVGLDPSFYDDYEFVRHNATIARRRGRVDAWGYAVRNRLPQGRLTAVLTRLFKRLRPAGVVGGPAVNDAAAMTALGEYFAPYNKELAERFGVDVSSWWPAAH